MKVFISKAILFFCLGFVSAFGANVEITSTDRGVAYSHSGIECRTTAGGLNLVNANCFITPLGSNGLSLDEIRFVVAVPASYRPEPVSVEFQTSTLSESATEAIRANHSKGTGQSFTLLGRTPQLRFEELGSRRGVRLLLAKVLPYAIDNDGRPVLISSLSFQLDFGIAMHSSAAPGSIAELFASCENISQLPQLLQLAARNDKKSVSPQAASFNPKDTAWYDGRLNYAKIITKQDGIAFATGDSIIAAQPAFAGADLRHLRLLYRGKEVPFAAVPDSAKLSSSTKIYFHGIHCPSDTAWFDYYTDEAVYFLEFNEDSVRIPLRHFPSVGIGDLTNGVQTAVHREKDAIYFHLDDPYNTETSPAENWYWLGMDPLSNPNIYDTIDFHPMHGQNYLLSVRLGSWYCDNENSPYSHRLGFYLNGNKVLDTLLPFRPRHTIECILPDSLFKNGTNFIKLSSLGLKDDTGTIIATDVLALDYYEIKGMAATATRNGIFFGDIDKNSEPISVNITGVRENTAYAIDSRNLFFGSFPTHGDTLEIHLPSSEFGYSIIASGPQLMERATVRRVAKTFLRSESMTADNIIIYHENFSQAANKYKEYHDANGTATVAINIDDIYKEYSYGKKNPWAIRYFLRDVRSRWAMFPEYLTILGGACSDPRKVLLGTSNIDYVPAYGMPLSDYWYSLLDEDSGSNLSSILIGRIPARTNQEAEDYLTKYIYVDTLKSQNWENNMLFISGGYGPEQRTRFRTVLTSGYNSMIARDLCADSITFSRYDDESSESQGAMIRDVINQGTGIIMFVGHGSPKYIDNDGWQVQRLGNTGRFPHLLTVSCNTADFAISSGRCRNDEYIMDKNLGCIGTMGFTYLSQVSSDYPIANNFFSLLADRKRKSSTYAGLLNDLKDKLGPEYKYYISMILAYLGDPLSKIRYAETDLFFPTNTVRASNHTNQTDLSEFDSTAFVDFDITNLGFRPNARFRVMAIRRTEAVTDTLYIYPEMGCHSASLSFPFPIRDMKGRHYLTIVIDPDSLVPDKDRSNNKLNTFFDVLPMGILMLDPISNLDVDPDRPIINYIRPNPTDTNSTKIIITNALTGDTVITSSQGEISNHELFSSWSLLKRLSTDSLYYLDAYSSGGTAIEKHTLHMPFHVGKQFSSQYANWKSFSADLANNSHENLMTDGNHNLIFDTIRAPFSITAAAWDADSNCHRLEIVYRNKTLVEISHEGARPRGFNIITIDGRTLEAKKYVRFDTWGDDLAPENDSTAIRLVAYLRDSISRDDYMFIGTCDESFRLTLVDKNLHRSGSIDTLKTVLAAYGLRDVDSLGFKATVAMVGKWNAAQGELPQYVEKNFGKVARIQGMLKTPMMNAKIISKIIGPAQSWKDFSMIGDLDDPLLEKRIVIKGLDKDKLNPVILVNEINTLSVPLDLVQGKDFPFIQAEIELSKASDSARAAVSALDCQYVYSPESAISAKLSGFVSDTVMKGDTATIKLQIWNIARRASFEPLSTQLALVSGNVTHFKVISSIQKLPALSYLSYERTIPTDFLLGNYSLQVHTDSPADETELYLFNNYLSLPLYVANDTEKPKLKLMINGKEVADGDFVPKYATARVELRDNSAIPVNKDEAVSIRLNGYILSDSNTDSWAVKDYGHSRPLKYEVGFSKMFSVNDNIIEVVGIDAAGNSDTLTMRLWVSRDASFAEVEAYPNPTPGDCSFEFDLKTPDAEGDCNIEIFDMMGKKVRTIDAAAVLGHNKVVFDGMDSDGNLIPQGFYQYRLNLVGRWAEPVIGKLIVVR